MDPHKIGFVVGLRAEMALLRGAITMVGVGGGAPEGAAEAAQRLADEGAQALVSFGLAGGLDPALPPGALLVPRMLIENQARFGCDAALLSWLGGATVEAMLAGEEIAVTRQQKALLFAATGAAAVDLESGAVARVAQARGLPFAVLRAVCDPAGRDLPPAALAALGAQGRIVILRVLASLLRHPAQLPGLLALAREAAAARTELSKQVAKLSVILT